MGCVCTSDNKAAKKQNKPFKASMDAYIVKDKPGKRTTEPETPPTRPKKEPLQVKDTRFTDEYVLKEQLSQSLTSEVRKVIHRGTGLARAVKIMKRSDIEESSQKKMLDEIETLMSLDHHNIVKVYEVFETKQKYFIVSEYLEGGELFERIVQNDKFSEEVAAKVMKQILSAVAYCHENGIIHGDLKPENLIYDSNKPDANLKIIDFDPTKAFDQDQKAFHIAPEVLNKNITEKCDVWSCGVLLYVLLSGIPPFSGKDNKEILRNVKSGKYTFEDFAWLDVSNEAQNFIKRMMEVDVNKRYSAQEALNDPWFAFHRGGRNSAQPMSTKKLRNLNTFIVESKLYESSRAYLGAYFNSRKEKEDLIQEYKTLDVNKTGHLGAEELKQGYCKVVCISNEISEEELDKILRTLTEGSSGKISYQEFVEKVVKETHEMHRKRLDAAFGAISHNGSDKVLAAELMLIFNGGKIEGMTDQQWNQWVKDVETRVQQEMNINQVKNIILSLTQFD